MKILFLASWYPSREHPISGIFVKRHAMAVARYCDVAVLYVNLGDVDDGKEVTKGDGIIEVRIYKKATRHENKWMKCLYDHVGIYMEYIQAGLNGYKTIEEEFGKPELAHVNVINFAGLIGLALKLWKGIPYIITEHWAGYFKADGGFEGRTRIGKYFIKTIGKNAAAIITVSGKLRDAMKACGIENKFFVIPNVVDIADCPEHLSCSKDKKIMIHISLLKDSVKNVSGIIEAVRLLFQKRDDFELHLIGDGNDRKKLEDMAKNYGLLDKVVFFLGMVDANEVAKLIYCSDFSIVNSNFETFSVSAAESLACGKPIITTRCGGPEEFVDDRCGLLVERGDVEGLAGAIEYMLDNCSKYNSIEIAQYASSRFSSDIVGKEIYDIYRKVLIL